VSWVRFVEAVVMRIFGGFVSATRVEIYKSHATDIGQQNPMPSLFRNWYASYVPYDTAKTWLIVSAFQILQMPLPVPLYINNPD
jgi:hypothetical protein